jgi:hypothetical protein
LVFEVLIVLKWTVIPEIKYLYTLIPLIIFLVLASILLYNLWISKIKERVNYWAVLIMKAITLKFFMISFILRGMAEIQIKERNALTE